jgi:hypothetical protein
MQRSHLFFAAFLAGCLVLIVLSRTAHAETFLNQQLFLHNLRIGTTDSDVERLQKYLNRHDAPVALSGAGSSGNETRYFGPATARAVRLFQELHTNAILSPFGLTKGTGNFYAATRNFVNQTLGQDPTPSAVSNTSGYYAVGGTITGVTGPTVLKNNTDVLTLTPGGTANFQFPKKLAAGQSYNITVTQSPTGQQCFIAPGQNSIGTVHNSDVNITIQCSSNGINPFMPLIVSGGATTPTTPITYTIGGTVSGLTDTVILNASNGDSLTISSNGAFTFATPVAEGSPYNVTVQTQPSGQTCVVTNGTGTTGGSNVTNVSVSCSVALVSITVTSSSSHLPATITEQFTATGQYVDGSKADITASVAWDTSDHSIATISGTGLGTGVNTGTAQISATLDGVTGTTNLTVTDAVLAAIIVSPTNSNLPVSINSQYGASGIFSDGTFVDITNQVTWDTSDHGTATIGSTGLATGVASGAISVSATLGDVIGTTTVTVTDAVLVAITVTPSFSNLPVGINSQYTAVGTFSDGSTVDITNQATWGTSHPDVATISGTGLATGVVPGTTQISAILNDVLGTTNLTVTDATLVSIAVLPNNSHLPVGINSQYTAIGTFSDATSVDITNQATWGTSNHTVATINSIGLGTGANAGTTSVSARLGDVIGTTNLTVTNATLVSIAITPLSPSVARGSTLQLSAIGTFSDAFTVDITNQAIWTSANKNVATVRNIDPRGQVTGVAGGSTSIRANFNSIMGATVVHVGA